jgi:hypothetical protein
MLRRRLFIGLLLAQPVVGAAQDKSDKDLSKSSRGRGGGGGPNSNGQGLGAITKHRDKGQKGQAPGNSN